MQVHSYKDPLNTCVSQNGISLLVFILEAWEASNA
jgi:hypothetical protein